MSRMLAVLGAGMLAPALLTAQTPDVQVRLGGYAQFQFSTSSVGEQDVPAADLPSSTFELRRIRPTVDITIDEWITARIQPDFGGARARLADAWMNLAFSDAAELRIGHFKKPFSRLELTSSSRILPIERGVRIANLDDALLVDALTGATPVPAIFDDAVLIPEHYALLDGLGHLGRDIGAALHGGIGDVAYEIGVFNGQTAETTDVNDGKSVAARAVLAHSEALSIGFGASWRETSPDEEDAGIALELDAEWGGLQRPGLHLIAEAAWGENLGLPDGNFLGFQGIAGWYMPRDGRFTAIEPILRLSFGDASLDRDGDSAFLLTPGVNVYLFGRSRLMLNWDLFMPGGDGFDSEHALRFQTQVAF